MLSLLNPKAETIRRGQALQVLACLPNLCGAADV
jgi:hypothetical protein